MREINVKEITDAVEKLFIKANYNLPKDISCLIEKALTDEKSETCKNALKVIRDNESAAKELNMPICQDTGMAVVFAEIGQDVHIVGGSFKKAVNEGVHNAYINGYMRCSVVEDPIKRKNTGDNTPAVIFTDIVDGESIKITAAPKGFGSENMSAVKMMNPSVTADEIADFVVQTVVKAGSKPCPPIIVGVGIGGDFEYSALLSKKALIRQTDKHNEDDFYAELENNILEKINKTGIGAQGFGGDITALAVNIEKYPTHIAGLPVAVNIGCHVTRHETIIL